MDAQELNAEVHVDLVVDGGSDPFPNVEDVAAAPPEPTLEGPFEIGIDAWTSVMYSLAHNRVPVINELSIALPNGGAVGLLTIDVSMTWAREAKPPAKPVSLTIDCPTPGGPAVRIEDVGLKLDDTVLVDLEEAVPATIRVTVRDKSGIAQYVEHEVQVLARNQWYLRPDYPELIAAHVQPNHPATKEVLSAAAEILESETGSSAIEGYQSGPERAKAIARAIFLALQARGLHYINPPASFLEHQGVAQKVRPLDEVLEGAAGTCVDLACAYASCLEQAGLRPVIWFLPGHAFAGFLTVDEGLPEPSEGELNTMLTMRDVGMAVPVETVALTVAASYEGAVEKAQPHFAPGGVSWMVDVTRARRSGTLPLPARVQRGNVVTVVIDDGPGTAPLVVHHDRQTGKVLPDSIPPRVSRWKSNLLDLSLRNPLIRFNSRRSGMDLLPPRGYLGRIEDDLFNGQPVIVMPGDKLEGVDSAAERRHASELASDRLRELYENTRILYSPMGEKEGASRARTLASKARLIESETGANNLYLVLGTLVWSVKGKSDEIVSPVFLVPVRLVRRRGVAFFGVALDESGFTSPNYCLVEKLKAEWGLEVPYFERPEEDDAGVDVEKGLAALRSSLLERGLNFRVDDSAHLAVLQFSKFRLWKDMNDHWQTFLENRVVRHLVEHPGEPFNDEAEPLPPERLAAAETSTFCPIPADGSQLGCIVRAQAGHSFVIEGPPGTGKSQTITNLLANSLAAGKTVLFVAQKQAALNVVKERLQEIGLDPYCLDLHNKGSKPNEIREQLKDALESRPWANSEEFEEGERVLASVHGLLDDYRTRLYTENRLGFSYASAQHRQLALPDGPAAPVPRSLFDRNANDVKGLQRAVLDAVPAIQAAKPELHHVWRFSTQLGFDAIDRQRLARAVSDLHDRRQALGELGQGALGEVLHEVKTPNDLASLVTLLEWLAARSLPTSAALQATVDPEWQSRLDQRISDAARTLEKAAKLRKEHGGGPLAKSLERVEADVQALGEASASFFLGRRGRTRKALASLLDSTQPPKIPVAGCVDIGQRFLKVRRAMAQSESAVVEAAGELVPAGFRVDAEGALESLKESARRASVIGVLLGRMDRLGEAARALGSASETTIPGLAKRLRGLSDALGAFMGLVSVDEAALAKWTDDRSLLVAIDASLPGWRQDSDEARFLTLQRWVRLQEQLVPLAEAGLDGFVAMILDGQVASNEVDRVFERGLARRALQERAEATELDTFDRSVHEQTIDRYLELTDDRRAQLRTMIPAMLTDARSFNPDVGFGAVNELRIELQRQRGAKSVRTLIDRFPELIQQLTPCFLMSPDSVAKFIPPGRLTFDMVVFDEASQIEVAEAVGAMGRARSVVVAGDSKQMPPTRFGASGLDDDDGLYSPQQDEDDDVPEDGESLLVEAVNAGLSQEWLSWHYRSRDESLITFSNEHYYGGRLSSFPVPAIGGRGALRWIPVDGQFEHGGRRINPVEAKAVADEVLRRLNDPATKDQSIGVVTLNKPQQDEVIRLLQASGDERVADMLGSDTQGPNDLLIRNLENVQGNERDVIILSTGFSRAAGSNVMPLRFGPLNRPGGERRLNVAVTRARQELIVFSSFEPEDIDDKRTSSIGLLHLREFLMMAKYGAKPIDEDADEHGGADVYRDDVQQALEAAGLTVASDVGLSPFRVDLAVNATGASQWDVAVLLDGRRWRKRQTVGDRDGLPTTVLSNLMGWPRVVRVWMPSWREERDAVVQSVRSAVEEAEIEREKRLVEAERQEQETANAEAHGAHPNPWRESETRGDLSPAEVPPTGGEQPSPPRATEVPDGAMAFTHQRGEAHSVPVSMGQSNGTGLNSFVPYPERPLLGTPEQCSPDWIHPSVDGALLDAIEAEGPVELNRLAKIVSLRFDVTKLHAKRARAIQSRVPRGQLFVSRLGTFVWPEGVTPDAYDSFRASPYEALRGPEEIAPEEWLNAMRHVVSEAMSIEPAELNRVTAGLFGFRRITSGINERMARIIELGIQTGQLVDEDSRIRLQ